MFRSSLLVLNSKSQFSASKQDFTVVTETYLEKVPVKIKVHNSKFTSPVVVT